MNLLDVLTKHQIEESLTSRVYGVVTAVVAGIDDPDEKGRVKVTFPWLKDGQESPWARVMSFMAGKDRGAMFRPEVDDEVLVLFEHGDMRRPYIIGALWNGKDNPPEDGGANADNHVRLIKSRSGHIIKLDDTPDGEKIEITDQKGANTLIIDSAADTVTIAADKDIQLQAPNGKIILEGGDVEINSSGTVKIEAASNADVNAGGTLNISGKTVNIN